MPENDWTKRDSIWFGIISGILGGLFDGDCIVEGTIEDIDDDCIEEFFLDEQREKERKWVNHQRKNVQTVGKLYM